MLSSPALTLALLCQEPATTAAALFVCVATIPLAAAACCGCLGLLSQTLLTDHTRGVHADDTPSKPALVTCASALAMAAAG